ncbi:hypothetical protein ACFS07_11080 [Undibacterium arcticum]
MPLLAHEEARKLMETRGADQLKAMQALLREKGPRNRTRAATRFFFQ